MSLNPDTIEFEKLLKSGIGNSPYFKWHEALLQHNWDIYAVPESDMILENIIETSVVMDKIRKFFNSAITVTSWYRCNPYNTSINGAMNSAHKLGLAVDFIVYGKSCDAARNSLLTHEKLEEFGICMEKNPGDPWVHIDLMKPRKVGGRYFNP